VDEIAAPGALGEFGVLPGHVPFMTALKPGVLSTGPRRPALSRRGRRSAASGAQRESDKISVLVDRGEPARDIDRDTAAQELAAVDAELAKTKAETAAEVKALLGKRAWAAARVDAANRVK